MNRSELVDRCKRIIEEAYQEATEMIVAYLEKHPNEPRQPLCREVDPDNWKALESRVMRLQEKRRSGADSDIAIGRKPSWQVGDARRAFSNPEISPDVKADLVAGAMADDSVASQVAARINSDPDLRRTLDRAQQRRDRDEVGGPTTSLAEEWERWLTRLNSVLTEGARLAERTEKEGDQGLVPQIAIYAYQLITEKKLDADLRALLDEGVRDG